MTILHRLARVPAAHYALSAVAADANVAAEYMAPNYMELPRASVVEPH